MRTRSQAGWCRCVGSHFWNQLGQVASPSASTAGQGGVTGPGCDIPEPRSSHPQITSTSYRHMAAEFQDKTWDAVINRLPRLVVEVMDGSRSPTEMTEATP